MQKFQWDKYQTKFYDNVKYIYIYIKSKLNLFQKNKFAISLEKLILYFANQWLAN